MTTLAGRYRLIERLGAGGMSVVWRAYDEVLGRPVAVKLLAGEFAAAPGFQDRIRREAQAVARLSHPGIAQVHDYGETPGADGVPVPFVVMELVGGQSAGQLLSRGPLPWRTALDLAAQVADALAAAHARGLVHRDVTPGNVMVQADGRVKVVDFGISAVEGEVEGTHLFGTPAYLSPERLAGAPALPATDIYCLGVLTCQLLAGRAPVDGRLAGTVAGLPAQVPVLLARCLAIEPVDRPGAVEVADRLRRALHAGTGRSTAPGAAVPTTAAPTIAVPTVTVPTTSAQVTVARRVAQPPHGGTRVLAVPPPVPVAPPPPRRRTWLVAVLGVVAVLAFVFGALYGGGSSGRTAQGAIGASPKSSPPPPPSPTVKCSAQFKVTVDLKVTFTATLTVKIEGTVDVTGWRVEFDFPGNQHVDSGWPGKYAQEGRHVTIRNDNWNAVLEAGKSYSSVLLAHYTGDNAKPPKIIVNGVRCADSAGQ